MKSSDSHRSSIAGASHFLFPDDLWPIDFQVGVGILRLRETTSCASGLTANHLIHPLAIGVRVLVQPGSAALASTEVALNGLSR